ncbi:MFS transporter [Actinomycetospora sp. TBRC 11914]|uniref:MFS transporter n=1 Tax=Actinomycetospora sp. TBRC 11914 TaxID=2729387 RepID=UPI00145DDF3F|nr:MFS transporter [Actinomycetospora sp. TBRC 11914]NMO89499.1 MHS family MFS transporter [Actinomycetospora sp. TBRC 11914]
MATTRAGTDGAEAVLDRREVRRTSLVSLLGSTIEWYDFFIYGTAAALVLNTAFFPTADPFVGTLAAFSSFAVGFIARPVGGIIWGHYGDRIGRKKALVSALFLMGASTTLVGLLPSYATIGVAAPVLLFVLRIVQGLAVGGQWGGAVLIATEYAPPHRKGWYGSFPQLGVPIAVIVSNGIFLGLEAGLGEEAFTSWGWRVPFLLSVLLIGVALYAQLRLEDTPAFRQVQAQAGARRRSPVIEVLRSHPKQVLLAAGSFIAVNGGFYIYVVYVLSYGAKALHLPESVLLIGILGSSAVNLAAIPLFALLSDRVGRRPVYLAGAIGTVVAAFPVFWLIDTRSTFLIFLGLLIGGVANSAMYGPQAAFFAELFSAEVRYSGASLGYQIGAVLGGGLAPLIAASLYQATGTSASTSAYLLVMGVVTAVCAWLLHETHRGARAREQEVSP